MNEIDRVQLLLDGWKQTVQVQMHFNDIEIRIRNMAITVVGALLGAGAFSAAAGIGASPVFLGAIAFVAWLAFYFMDRFWYHRLLVGSIEHGAGIEDALKEVLPEIHLTAAISKTSPIKLWRFELHSKGKMDIFYTSIAFIIMIGTSLLA